MELPTASNHRPTSFLSAAERANVCRVVKRITAKNVLGDAPLVHASHHETCPFAVEGSVARHRSRSGHILTTLPPDHRCSKAPVPSQMSRCRTGSVRRSHAASLPRSVPIGQVSRVLSNPAETACATLSRPERRRRRPAPVSRRPCGTVLHSRHCPDRSSLRQSVGCRTDNPAPQLPLTMGNPLVPTPPRPVCRTPAALAPYIQPAHALPHNRACRCRPVAHCQLGGPPSPSPWVARLIAVRAA